MKKILLFLLVSFSLNAVFSQATRIIDCKEAMALLDKTVKNFKSFEGRFAHSETSQDGRTTNIEEGEVFLKRGGKIKFVYSNPEGKIAVSNGKTAYLYLKEDNSVYKMKIFLKNKLPILAKIIMGQVVPSKEFFCAFSQKEGNITTIQLGSKEKDSSLRHLEVEINEKTYFFSRISYINEYDQKVVFDFIEGRSDKEIPDQVFEFTPPKGAKLLESKEDFEQEMNF